MTARQAANRRCHAVLDLQVSSDPGDEAADVYDVRLCDDLFCDCLDRAKDYLCKHILAVAKMTPVGLAGFVLKKNFGLVKCVACATDQLRALL